MEEIYIKALLLSYNFKYESTKHASLVPSPTLESGSGSPYIRSWVSVTSYYITKRIVSTWPFV